LLEGGVESREERTIRAKKSQQAEKKKKKDERGDMLRESWQAEKGSGK